jgi:hypothetical protein
MWQVYLATSVFRRRPLGRARPVAGRWVTGDGTGSRRGSRGRGP